MTKGAESDVQSRSAFDLKKQSVWKSEKQLGRLKTCIMSNLEVRVRG